LATTVTGSEHFTLSLWGYMKAMVYAHKVNTGEELLQQILNAAVLPKFTSSLVTQVRKCIQAGGHFKQLAGVVNSASVTAHLATYLNKCTMLSLPFYQSFQISLFII